MGKLRFAPLVRVSTEKQDKRGESLRTQTQQLEEYVKELGGIVANWYRGQESASVDEERLIFDQLLADAQSKQFDAVIIRDADRWSRNNLKSEQGLKVLRDNGIRFFEGRREYDLHDPNDRFVLANFVNLSQFTASLSARKSLENRIARAKRGYPTTNGQRPYGRVFDDKTKTWSVDPEKKRLIEWAAREYINGTSAAEIIAVLGMSRPNFHRMIMNDCGPEWQQAFHSDTLNIHEVVPTEIPAILDEATIEAIKARAWTNRRFRDRRFQYLLGGVIYCGDCGYSLYGQAGKYYRHSPKGCKGFNSIPAEPLEEAVFSELFSTMGDRRGMEQAMQRAIPDKEGMLKAIREREVLEKELQKIGKRKDAVVGAIAEEVISHRDAKHQMDSLREQEATVKGRVNVLNTKLQNQPKENMIRAKAKLIKRTMQDIYRRPQRMKKMGFEDRRGLIKSVFGDKDVEGKPYGVYVTRPESEDLTWSYEIRGQFINQTGLVSKSFETGKCDLASICRLHIKLP